jgi:hypothetical protein
MINTLPYSITLSVVYDWQDRPYVTDFKGRVDWIKRNFPQSTIVIDTETTFQAQLGYSNLITTLEVIETSSELFNARLTAIARFA